MSSSSKEPKASKRRSGRKRLPPLPHQGSPFQFVVAQHPDHFRDDQTMRNIRSHVMYRHREERQHSGGSRSPRNRSISGERDRTMIGAGHTPSPDPTESQGSIGDSNCLLPPRRRSTYWDGEFRRIMSQTPFMDPTRELAARIISTVTAEPIRSAPPAFDRDSEYPFSSSSLGHDSLHLLKVPYMNSTDFLQDRAWMEVVCSNRMSFLSHVSAACVYRDVAEGYLEDTPLTVYAKSKLIQAIQNATQADDFTILSILHLLISDIGGFNEDVVNVHQDALVRIVVQQRGGINNLGLHGNIATLTTIVILCFTALRSHPEPLMLHGFVPGQRQSSSMGRSLPISPLYAPHGSITALYGRCSNTTYEVLRDMQGLTQIFIARWHYGDNLYPQASTSQLASYDARMSQIYSHLLQCPPTDGDIAPDWIYESCRLAALIYCRSIMQGLPLSDSANIIDAQASHPNSSGITLISALHNALERTDKRSYWGDLYGVFLWVCLVGGAASWPSTQLTFGEPSEYQNPTAWIRKCFALYSVRASLSHDFQHAGSIAEAQRTMLQVQNLVTLKRGISSQ